MAMASSKKKSAYLVLLATLLAFSVKLLLPLLQVLVAPAAPIVTVSVVHMLACLLCAAWSALGMEFYARWAHRELWHGQLWWAHKSHHTDKKESDLFELNDIFSLANMFVVIPIMYWSLNVAPVSIGAAGLLGFTIGISVFGMGYMLIHDGVHHRRFPAHFIVEMSPWVKKVVAAHAEHHKRAMGPPYGMFLGPQELEAEAAGKPPAPAPRWLLAGNLALAVGTSGCLLMGI